MKTILAACLLSLALVGRAEATPTVNLSWDGGPVAHPAYNRTRAEGSIATVVVTATGFNQPVRGVGVRIWVRSQYDGMPDAWRYEPGGCAAGGFQTPEVAVDPDCPFLGGTNSQRLSSVEYSYGKEVFYFALVHDPVAVSPNARYTIAQFRFDTSKGFSGLGLKSDSCGCIDQPQGVAFLYAVWLGADGNEYPFAIGTSCLNWEDPNNTVPCPYFGCDLCGPGEPPTPVNPCADQVPTTAAPRSWGSLKAAYR